MTVRKFQEMIRAWYRHHGRHDLPWRKFPRSLPARLAEAPAKLAGRQAYRILVSEVMLQQTQVSRVLRYYPRFLGAFPDLRALDRAPLPRVLRAWQGMGYNRRALYLKRLAHIIMAKYAGRIPRDPAALRELPGIGPATAGAIAAFAFGKRVAFLETNIRRVYLHFFFPYRRHVADREIFHEIRRTMPGHDPRQWYYALMDYGALALKGVENPNRRSAGYTRQPPFAGSRRELRGQIITTLIREHGIPLRALEERVRSGFKTSHAIRNTVAALTREGLLVRKDGRVTIPQ